MKLIHWDKWLSWLCSSFCFFLLFAFHVALARSFAYLLLLLRFNLVRFGSISISPFHWNIQFVMGDMQSIAFFMCLLLFLFSCCVMLFCVITTIHTDKWFPSYVKISIPIRFRRQRILPDIHWIVRSLECETSNHRHSNIPSHKIDGSDGERKN